MSKYHSTFYFIVGLLSAFCVRVLGIITIGEILIILFTLWNILSKQLKWNVPIFDSNTRTLILLLILASISSVLTNLLCNASINEILKGFGTISLLIFSFLFFKKMLIDRFESIITFLLGYGLSFIIVNLYFIQFSDLIVGDRGLELNYYREEMYAYIICNIAFFINGYLYSKNIKVLLVANLALALICLFGNSRSNFLMLIITDFILLCNYRITVKGNHLTVKTLFNWSILLCILLFLSYEGYSFLASNGYLGDGAKLKYEIQSKNKGGILSARSYIVRGFITIAHHPMGGIGTKHEVADNEEIRHKFAQVTQTRYRYWDRNIMSHTAIFDWWIAYGILTFPFWLYVIYLAFKGLKIAVISKHPLVALVIFSTLTLLWNMFNSPFSLRVQYGFSIMLLIFIIYINSIEEAKNGTAQNYC
ncbi:hypothetical protein [Coprobacter secundus]|uniref:hypothetical protein n=1 Tax=Coprobacter secundus TaxID=1501392 RepID=UPI003521FBFF